MASPKCCIPRLARYSLVAGAGLVLNVAAHAQGTIVTPTDWGKIDSISSAWLDDGMAVQHSAPFVNSRHRVFNAATGTPLVVDECTITNAGYATDPSDPGHKLHHALIIGAYLHNKQVRLLVQGCAYNKPRIISVEVRD
jgi:hypothetical protein